ncbi:hypothetical protein [Streptomyces plumbiresistens]|uniref:Lipoprotein n=1 Tax=Streptomyces plumbiresistens TaxID=511811 RepID=A0ABP7PZZ4_9ACTN
MPRSAPLPLLTGTAGCAGYGLPCGEQVTSIPRIGGGTRASYACSAYACSAYAAQHRKAI